MVTRRFFGSSRQSKRDPECFARNRAAARSHLSASGRRHRQDSSTWTVSTITIGICSPGAGRSNEVVGAYLLGPSDEILAPLRPYRVLYQRALPMETSLLDRISPGSNWDVRSCARNIRRPTHLCCSVERHRSIPGPESPLQIVFRTGEHQQRLYRRLASADGEVSERLPAIARVRAFGASAQSVPPSGRRNWPTN